METAILRRNPWTFTGGESEKGSALCKSNLTQKPDSPMFLATKSGFLSAFAEDHGLARE
jgi:hypothetical protein